MINKLRRKFILIAMICITVVLVVILGSINIASYLRINERADQLLLVLTQNGGMFPKPDKPQGAPRKPMPPNMSPEAPYETRFFTVSLNSTGDVTSVDTGFIAAISTKEAVDYGTSAFKRGGSSGFFDQYKYSKLTENDSTLIVFLDCSRDLSTFQTFLFTSVLVSLAGILSVLVLVVIFSKMAIRPVAQSYEKQKRFITDASHEIKTPLAIIGASAEVLELQSGENEWTKSIKNQISRLTSLTSSLVSLSRMDEENSSLQITDFSLSDAVSEAVEPFKAVAMADKMKIHAHIEKNISYHGDEQAIRQLVSILADNTLKYTNENGQIKVSLSRHGKRCELSFFNTVGQIEKGNLDVLFERFYRADSSRNSSTGGYGIGLSIAKAIVELHHGKITANSIDGKSIVILVCF